MADMLWLPREFGLHIFQVRVIEAITELKTELETRFVL